MPRAAQRDMEPPRSATTKSLSLEEVDRQYAGKWVLLQVTEMSPLHAPYAGTLIAVGTHSKIYKVLRQLLPDRAPGTLYYIHQAGPWIRSPAALERYLQEHLPADDSLRS